MKSLYLKCKKIGCFRVKDRIFCMLSTRLFKIISNVVSFEMNLSGKSVGQFQPTKLFFIDLFGYFLIM